MIEAIILELQDRIIELEGQRVETLYFGGGTPSMLDISELQMILKAISGMVSLEHLLEVTMECNPDDLTPEYLERLQKETLVNRISIGIQSFHQPHLKMMNRAHSSFEAVKCLEDIFAAGFSAVTADLIFGLPDNDLSIWKSNLAELTAFPVSHISCYGLTIEPHTAMKHAMDKGLLNIPDELAAREQFVITQEILAESGFEQYEISNYALPGKYAVHNTNYWKQVPYLGVGPSAHSFNGRERRKNIAHNAKYLSSVSEGQIYWETELLSEGDRYNEWVMTGLRTKWGIQSNRLKSYSEPIQREFETAAKKAVKEGWIQEVEGEVILTSEGRVLADFVISSFFYV